MRFFLLSGAALLALASAVELNEWPAAVEAGKSYNITYSPKDNTPTTLTLRKGDRNDLKDVAVLTTTATGGSFLWTVDRALENDNDYALQIEQANADPNYSSQFPLTGGVDDDNDDDDTSSSAARPSATSASSASASTPASSSGNGTVTSAALSTTASPTASPTATDDDDNDDDDAAQSSQTDAAGAPQNTGAASALGSSPLALLFGAAAAVVYLN